MSTTHKLIIGDCTSMEEIADESVHLMVTSPPYYNVPFDYENLYSGYGEYLKILRNFAKET